MNSSSTDSKGRSFTRPVIAVTSGDPAGIGPEIVVRFFSEFTPKDSAAVLLGDRTVFEPWLERTGFGCPAVDRAEIADLGPGQVYIFHTDVGAGVPPYGADSSDGGLHAGRAIEIACGLANNGSVAGIVTAPISKKSLQLANFPYPGHTEMLARYLNAPDCQMMMVYDHLRIVPLTRHLPLRTVSDSVTTESIMTCIRETAKALIEDFGVPAPRIGVAGLNPHAGDAGVIGNEELEVIIPALERLCDEGIDVTGPIPGDALFPLAYRAVRRVEGEKLAGGGHDAYVSMYHDQGLIPFKMLSQRRGVNVTVGLPVIRASVDHGVAYDVAGRGIAETESLRQAYKLAEKMCIHRARK